MMVDADLGGGTRKVGRDAENEPSSGGVDAEGLQEHSFWEDRRESW